jgi:hypothetical protein
MTNKCCWDFSQNACFVQGVWKCGMTLPEGTPGKTGGGAYPSNALLLKAQRHSQLIRIAADVLEQFSINPSIFSVIVSETATSFSANAS